MILDEEQIIKRKIYKAIKEEKEGFLNLTHTEFYLLINNPIYRKQLENHWKLKIVKWTLEFPIKSKNGFISGYIDAKFTCTLADAKDDLCSFPIYGEYKSSTTEWHKEFPEFLRQIEKYKTFIEKDVVLTDDMINLMSFDLRFAKYRTILKNQDIGLTLLPFPEMDALFSIMDYKERLYMLSKEDKIEFGLEQLELNPFAEKEWC